ncbi:hypothetical protein HF086_011763 [Spodoptera exigua]|uniref:Uncharacterized protein n=1 Tax=Spodoptera exigua TaxID=7107 RepID=A0A922MHB1_SPOEX|nr:hypothetical protein HF086_011763 [Spodoptera exigua]
MAYNKFKCGSEDSRKPNSGEQAGIGTQWTNDVKVNSPPCHSPGAILPDLPQPAEDPEQECETVLVSGPNGARVRLTDDLVRHMPDNSFYRLERVDDCSALLLCPTKNN